MHSDHPILGKFNPAAVKDLARSIIDEAADDRIRGFQALAAHDREELKAAYERISELEDLARNVAGFDAGLLNCADLNVIRNALIEWRDQAQGLLP